MSLDIPNLNFKLFEGFTTVGKRELYAHNNIISGASTGFENYGLIGSGVVTQNPNQVPALAAGSMKRIISRVTNNGGGRMDYFTVKNGANTLHGSIIGVGITEFNFDAPFLNNDLINMGNKRNDTNGTIDHINQVEIEWDEDENIKHMYGGWILGGGAAASGFFGITQPNVFYQFPVTDEAEFQWRAAKSGKILDFQGWGISPVGVDNTPELSPRINGADVNAQVLSQHNGFAQDRFNGVDVSFSKDDLISFRGRSADLGTNLSMTVAARIKFD